MEGGTAETNGSNGGSKRRAAAKWGSWTLPLAVFGALALLYFTWTPLRELTQTAWRFLSNENREGFADWIEGYGAWGPIVILASMLFQTLAAFIPSLLVMVVSVLAFGPFWGAALNVAGLLLGAAMAYGIGAALGAPVVEGLIGDATEQKLERWVDRYGFWTVVAFRLSPVLSSDGVSYVGGVLRMGFARFLAATAIGVAPFSALVSWLGEDGDRLEAGLIWMSAVSVVALAGSIAYDHRRRRRDQRLR